MWTIVPNVAPAAIQNGFNQAGEDFKTRQNTLEQLAGQRAQMLAVAAQVAGHPQAGPHSGVASDMLSEQSKAWTPLTNVDLFKNPDGKSNWYLHFNTETGGDKTDDFIAPYRPIGTSPHNPTTPSPAPWNPIPIPQKPQPTPRIKLTFGPMAKQLMLQQTQAAIKKQGPRMLPGGYLLHTPVY